MLTDKSPDVTGHYGHFYDGGTTEWRRMSAENKARNIVDLSSGHTFENIVEIGAGDGAVLHQLSELGFASSVSVLEVSESAVEVIQNRGIRNLAEVTLFDGYSSSYGDNTFDLAILSHVIEHVEHPRLLLGEASRIAEYVFVEVPLELKLRTPRDFVWINTGHINLYSPVVIRQLLQSSGLRILEERVTNSSYDVYRFLYGKIAPFMYSLKSLALRAAPGVATHLFTYHWSALCRVSPERA